VKPVRLILTHLPHILAPLIGIAFLTRFALYVRRLPPAHLSDEELAEWHAERSRQREQKRGRGQKASQASEQALPR
jgi:hypothetical protein